jgi:hypothetical protein
MKKPCGRDFISLAGLFCGKVHKTNGSGIAEVGAFKEQMFTLAQMLIGIPMLKFSTSAPILPIPC